MSRWAVPVALALVAAGVLVGRASPAARPAAATQTQPPREERGAASQPAPAPPRTAAESMRALREEKNIDDLLAAAEELADDVEQYKDELLALVRSDLPARRIAALRLLMQLGDVDATSIEVVLGAARADPESDVRIAAIAALSSWMQKQPAHTEPLTQALVELARTESHDDVRGHAIQGIALLESPKNVVEPMAEFARSDRHAQNRALALMALGGSGPAALPHLEAAIAGESVADNRRAALIHVLRAGRDDAPAALERIAVRHADLASDAREYLEILKTERDPTKVYAIKSQRDEARGHVHGAHEHHD
jgi:hypothetical protein